MCQYYANLTTTALQYVLKSGDVILHKKNKVKNMHNLPVLFALLSSLLSAEIFILEGKAPADL